MTSSSLLDTLPGHWHVVQLRRVAAFRNGTDYKDVEVEEGGYPVYGSGGEFRRSSRYLYEGPSVLFGRKGTVDKPLLVNGRFWTVDTMFYTELAAIIDPRFLYYVATTIPFDLYRTNTAVPSMTQTDLASHRIPLPPLDEQRAIADYLDRETAQIDTLIAKQEQLITTLRERRTSTIDNLVLSAGGPNVTVKRTLSRSISDGPHETPEFIEAGIPFLSVDGIQEGELVFENCRYISVEDHLKYSAKIAPQYGDVLMGKAASTGKIAYVSTKQDFNVWSPLAILRPNREKLRGQWLAWALKTSRAQASIDMACTHNTQKNISMDDIGLLYVPLPPLNQQDRSVMELTDRTTKIDMLIAKAEQFIVLAKERRAALITAAVTGQITPRTLHS